LVSHYMWRNIIGQSVTQLLILMLVLYYGATFLRDEFYYWEFTPATNSTPIATEQFDQEKLHTMVFNTFVWLQIFNGINSRKLTKEKNVFRSMFSSAWFPSILVVSAIIQALMVELFGQFGKTVP